jgi:outer membrane protein assembly factor BamB
MMIRIVPLLSGLIALGVVSGVSGFPLAQIDSEFAANWPNFRGPTGNGTSETAKPPLTWGEDHNVAWKVELPGTGNNSSPIVWNDRVFVLTAIPVDSPENGGLPRRQQRSQGSGQRGGGSAAPVPTRFVTLCLDRATGKQRWQQTAVEMTPHEGTHPDHGFASASPCTDGRHVYSHFGSRGLYCYDMDGNLQWKRDDFGQMQTRNGFGEGSSPVLYGDTIVVPWDHEGPSYILALDALTGETRWKKERDEPSNWVTPVVVQHDGRAVLVTGGENAGRGYDLQTGEELWHVGGFTSRPISSPVVYRDLVMLASGRQGFVVSALQVGSRGELSSGKGLAWTSRKSGPDVPSMMLSGDRLYFMKGSNGILNCWNAATGREKYSETRLDGISSVYASPVAADDKVIIVGRDGTSVVLEDSDTFTLLATNKLDDRIDATPALAGNQVFLRGKRYLYCIKGE